MTSNIFKMIKVSAVLPSMNEEETIGICITKIRSVFLEYEIDGEIIIADNSEDQTPIIVKNLGATLITPDGKGYGYAYKYGFNEAKGEIIVMGDADNTYDFNEIPNLLTPIINGEADFVLGNRFKGKMEKGAMPWLHKYIGNPFLTWMLNLFYNSGINDTHCGFRAIKKESLDKLELKTDGMEFASEMIINAVKKKVVIKEIPINYYKRKSDDSKLSSFSDGWRHLKFIILTVLH